MARLSASVDLRESLLFGALISPTDPIAVIGMLRTAHAPKRLEVQMAGESLFNDGVGVVVFFALLGIAAGRTVGARAISLSCGGRSSAASRSASPPAGSPARILGSIDRAGTPLAIVVTLAIAIGFSRLAEHLHTSGPLAVVVAGLMLGAPRTSSRPSPLLGDRRRDPERGPVHADRVRGAGHPLHRARARGRPARDPRRAARPARQRRRDARLPSPGGGDFRPRSIRILTWGGLRGGLAVALALSVGPDVPAAPVLLAMTYVVVVFSIVVQGLTFRRLLPKAA